MAGNGTFLSSACAPVARDVKFIVDREGSLRFLSGSAGGFYKAAREDEPLRELLTRCISGPLGPKLREALQSGRTSTVEGSMPVDGQSEIADAVLIPLRNGDAGAYAVMGLLRVVTKHRSLRDAVAMDFVSALLESVEEPLCALDGDFRVVRANTPFARLWYSTPEALEGSACHEILRGKESPCRTCAARRTLASGMPASVVESVLFPDGKERYAETRTVPVGAATGHGAAYVLMRMRIVPDGGQAEQETGHPSSSLSICAWCKRVRNGEETWESLGDFVRARWRTELSHAICPECASEISR
ncbi:MAG: PAS domain-containing protein [Nitrospirota bacterium]